MAHRSRPSIKPILQAAVKLLALLSVMKWDVMVEFLQQLRAEQVDRSRWPVALQDAMSGTAWFDKWLCQAIYWYLIEMIAVRLKSGELRNPKIYEFNPDILYDPKRNKSNKTRSNERTKTIPANGIPPLGKRHNQTAAR